MQRRVRAGFTERTQLLAAISHDLQTPLTRLRLRLELVENEELRARLLQDHEAMQRLVRDEGGSVIPMYANNVDARSKKLAHSGKLGSNWELDGWKCLDRWWFA